MTTWEHLRPLNQENRKATENSVFPYVEALQTGYRKSKFMNEIAKARRKKRCET